MRLVRERDFFVCDYCGSYYFPDANRDGIRVLNEPSNALCPVCKTTLVVAALDSIRVLHCPECMGNLIEQPAFALAVQYLRRRADALSLPQPFNRAELKRPLQCPRCGRKMHTYQYGGAGNVVIDNCLNCSIIWLDWGEFNRIITVPGKAPLESEEQ
ncbi:MAG: zf-TFIIB domain-containing protein [Chloroflexota bacterium]